MFFFLKIIILMIAHLSCQNNFFIKKKKKKEKTNKNSGSWREVREDDLRVSLKYWLILSAYFEGYFPPNTYSFKMKSQSSKKLIFFFFE